MKGPIPRHQYSNFLETGERAELLAWAFGQRSRFNPTSLAGGVIDPKRRASERLVDLGPMDEVFSNKMRTLGTDVFDKTGTRQFDVEFYELEIVAHGDGAHFAAHSDIPIGEGRKPIGGDRTRTQESVLPEPGVRRSSVRYQLLAMSNASAVRLCPGVDGWRGPAYPPPQC